MAAMRVPLWLKIGWTVWLMVWVPLYWRQYGAQNFLFFCDLGNVLIGVALWLESALIFSWVACGVLLFQMLYAIDLGGALLTGHHVVGGTEYMFDPHVSLAIRLLSLFHLATPPLLLWAIWRLGYDRRGLRLQTVMTWIVVPINYFWHPEKDVNWARGLSSGSSTLCPESCTSLLIWSQSRWPCTGQPIFSWRDGRSAAKMSLETGLPSK